MVAIKNMIIIYKKKRYLQKRSLDLDFFIYYRNHHPNIMMILLIINLTLFIKKSLIKTFL